MGIYRSKSAVIADFLKLMKTKKEKESSAKFANQSADQDFKKLMRQFGVEETKKKQEKKPTTNKQGQSEPVRFNEDQDWNPSASPSSKAKYGDTKRPTAVTATKRKLKISPGFMPDAEIDLHGSTKEEALRKTENLVAKCRKNKHQTALIITGRGLNSGQEKGILRKAVWEWLINNSKHLNVKHRWAPAFLGGKGAIIVFFN